MFGLGTLFASVGRSLDDCFEVQVGSVLLCSGVVEPAADKSSGEAVFCVVAELYVGPLLSATCVLE